MIPKDNNILVYDDFTSEAPLLESSIRSIDPPLIFVEFVVVQMPALYIPSMLRVCDIILMARAYQKRDTTVEFERHRDLTVACDALD